MISTKQLLSKYGKPGDMANMVTIDLPYPMTVAWDKKQKITKMVCHKLVAANFAAVFQELLCVYGLPKLKELGIDLYGGCFNFRPMRGAEKKYADAMAKGNIALASTYLSKHSWATALDLDPERNLL